MDSTLKKLYVYSADLIEVDNNKPQDFDLYEIEARSSLETRELSLVVDFINKEVSGDILAFGSWYDLDKETVIELLNQLKKENKIEGCAKTVKERFESIEGVTNVIVDREVKKAVVDSARPIEELEFSNALAETKFTVVN